MLQTILPSRASGRINGVNCHRFAEGLGIKIRPIRRSRKSRPKGKIYALGTIRRLIASHGEDHASLVVRCILASDPTALGGDVISSVSAALRAHPARFANRSEAVEFFRAVPILKLRQRAQRLATGLHTLSTLVAQEFLDA